MLKSIFRQERGSRDGDDASKLLQTLSDSFSVEERRESSLGLKNALLDSSSSKSSVSSFGLEIICNAIRNDWKDEEVVRNCLESLAIIVDTSYYEVRKSIVRYTGIGFCILITYTYHVLKIAEYCREPRQR